MPAFFFNNTKGKSKFSGSIIFNGVEYLYELFLFPLINPDERTNIIDRISSRKRYNKDGTEEICLGIGVEDITDMIDNNDISAVGFVKEKDSEDEGSGTLQIYNWCDLNKKRKKNTIQNAQVWINDVCRNTPRGMTKSVVSPVRILFKLFEQLVAYNLSKDEIYLMVEKNEFGVLEKIYNGYGFYKDDSCFNPVEHECMKKTITKELSFSELPFIQMDSIQMGGINKNTRKRRKSKRNKRNKINSKTNKTNSKRK